MISVDWTKNLPEDQKKDFELQVRNSLALKRLRELITEYEASLQKSEISVDAYDNPSWAYKQAHINGRRQALHQLKTLITFDDRK